MAELADAADSKSADLRVLGVRLPLPAPAQINEMQWFMRVDDWTVLRRSKRRGGFSLDVLVKSRIIWQFFDEHERHISEPSAWRSPSRRPADPGHHWIFIFSYRTLLVANLFAGALSGFVRRRPGRPKRRERREVTAVIDVEIHLSAHWRALRPAAL
jgi:hypothetical protein